MDETSAAGETSNSVALAMSKIARDKEGEQAMSLLQGALQSVNQIQAVAMNINSPVAEGSVGTHVNIHV
ncbi:MAG: hypothetical protein IJ228_06175 [Succinivibrio sp.]|nr:hypothetical protein [Succinivibrio sp.]